MCKVNYVWRSLVNGGQIFWEFFVVRIFVKINTYFKSENGNESQQWLFVNTFGLVQNVALRNTSSYICEYHFSPSARYLNVLVRKCDFPHFSYVHQKNSVCTSYATAYMYNGIQAGIVSSCHYKVDNKIYFNVNILQIGLLQYPCNYIKVTNCVLNSLFEDCILLF